MERETKIIDPNILYFKILFKGGNEKDLFGLTKIKYLFKLTLN